MFRAIVCSALLVTLVSGHPAFQETEDKAQANLVLLTDPAQLNELKQAVDLIPLERALIRGKIRYTLGSRVSNDRLVSQSSDSYQWPQPRNIQLSLEYPANGTGAVISMVVIDVSQGTDLGRAYVIAGGIGQRTIKIVVEAFNTTWFDYLANIYGV